MDSAISYISDIHLNHKVKKKYKESVSEHQIFDYIYDLVKDLNKDYIESKSIALIVLGDVSFTYDLAKLFYTELKNQFSTKLIIATLGNHELWDKKLNKEAVEKKKNPVKYITQKYRKMFSDLGIIFLENDLLVIKNSTKPYEWYDIEVITEKEIITKDTEWLNAKCKHNIINVIGGLGFSGYEEKFNATMGIYRDAIKNLEDDLYNTQRFEQIYKKLKQTSNSEKIIVATHTPKRNWSRDDYCKNWIYLSGHTHQNTFSIDDEKIVYSDNQIGYDNMSISLKHFYVNTDYDIFDEYEDGIYTITRDQYYDFYHGRKLGVTYNRKNTKIHMLKKRGYYCFIQENLSTGSFCILNGGEIKTLSKGNNLQYYYDNLDLYAITVENFVREYNNNLMKLSQHVKSFEGYGRIHGCIVDIDFFNHLYLNPYDGKVTPYYATSVVNKYVYENIPSLLSHKLPSLMKNYNRLITKDKENSLMVYNNNNLVISNKRQLVKSTEIYKVNKIVLGMQYITKNKVLRSWNDNLINNKELLNTKDLLFIDLIK